MLHQRGVAQHCRHSLSAAMGASGAHRYQLQVFPGVLGSFPRLGDVAQGMLHKRGVAQHCRHGQLAKWQNCKAPVMPLEHLQYIETDTPALASKPLVRQHKAQACLTSWMQLSRARSCNAEGVVRAVLRADILACKALSLVQAIPGRSCRAPRCLRHTDLSSWTQHAARCTRCQAALNTKCREHALTVWWASQDDSGQGPRGGSDAAPQGCAPGGQVGGSAIARRCGGHRQLPQVQHQHTPQRLTQKAAQA